MRKTAIAAVLFCLVALPGLAGAPSYPYWAVSCSEPFGTSCEFDSEAAAWLAAAAAWPGAGPIFDARELVVATWTTFVVSQYSPETFEIDQAMKATTSCEVASPGSDEAAGPRTPNILAWLESF